MKLYQPGVLGFIALTICALGNFECVRLFPGLPERRSDDLLYSDDFEAGLSNWHVELENGGTVTATHGILDIDVPAGATVWFRPYLTGPLRIEYQATAVRQGGPNDRVSDLNCFWMARDSRSLNDIFAVSRSGKFFDYNPLFTYYVGLGGNRNTTTRFRRYIASPTTRPLRPQDDLSDSGSVLVPNKEEKIELIAAGNDIQFRRNGRRIFQLSDPNPYSAGWFALRTTASHLEIKNFKVFKLGV